MSDRLAGLTHREADYSGLRVVVAGLGVSGFAAADALLERGAHVTVVDGKSPPEGSAMAERAQILDVLGAHLDLGPGRADAVDVDGLDLVVTSPGWPPTQPLLAAAAAAGVPIWGEVELAWRMRAATGAAPWLTVTGTNGKTTTVQMLTSILRAAGLRATSAGNVGTPILEAVLDPAGYDAIAVELSSFQLHWSSSLRPQASACLNVAPDHVDWHGSFEEYLATKGRVYTNTERACIYTDDPATLALVEAAEVQEGCRAVGVTTGVPAISMLGVVDDVLADRAFVEARATSAAEIGTLADLVPEGAPPAPPHVVSNALVAAALARAHGVPPVAVRDGLRAFVPEPHRAALVTVHDGVAWINDSKATNPHAAAASLAVSESIVWIAGGLLKGADVGDLVSDAAGRLRAVILIGADRDQFAQALARHAPNVPVLDLGSPETGAMELVVERALGLARSGDAVLLAPAAASMDMFENYQARGDEFEAAVRRIVQA